MECWFFMHFEKWFKRKNERMKEDEIAQFSSNF